MRSVTICCAALLLAAGGSGCAHRAAEPPAIAPAAAATPAARPAELTGTLSREQIEAAYPDWVRAEVESPVDEAAARALLSVPPGARVCVFLRTTCSDSRRELGRLWAAFDRAGATEFPFELLLIGLDRSRGEPGGRAAGRDIRFVPTFIVERDGREVGRIVETSPTGIERDLLRLLDGSARGVLSQRTDLSAPPS